MTEKILTIIIPSYNVSKYISKTLESMVNIKNINKLDIIVVDDGSKDNTAAIAYEYFERYPKSVNIIRKENGGHGSTLNSGLAKAKGLFTIIVDGDDWIESSTLDYIIECLPKQDIDVLVTNYKTYNEITCEYEERICKCENYDNIYTMKYINDNCIFMPMATLCVRTDKIKSLNQSILENTFYVDEQYCVFALARISKIKFLNKFLYYYRVGNINQSMNMQNQINNIDHKVRVLNSILSFYNQNDFDIDNKIYIERKLIGILKSIYLIMLVSNMDKRQGRIYVKRIREEIDQTCIPQRKKLERFYKICLLLSYLHCNNYFWSKLIKIQYKIKNYHHY